MNKIVKFLEKSVNFLEKSEKYIIAKNIPQHIKNNLGKYYSFFGSIYFVYDIRKKLINTIKQKKYFDKKDFMLDISIAVLQSLQWPVIIAIYLPNKFLDYKANQYIKKYK